MKFEHNGFTLSYSDNSDTWMVWELRLEDKSIAKLKQKVNKYVANRLKTANLIVGVNDSYSAPTKKQVVSRDAATGEYWVKDLDDDRRQRVKADKLFPWTPKIDEQIKAYHAKTAEGQAILREARKMLDNLQKPSKDAIAEMLLDLAKAPVEDE